MLLIYGYEAWLEWAWPLYIVFNMDEVGRRGLPKFSEILRRPRGEAEVND